MFLFTFRRASEVVKKGNKKKVLMIMPAWQTILPALRVKGLFKDSSSTSSPQVLLSFTWRGCLYLNKFWKIPLESPSFLSGTGQWLCLYTPGMLTSFKIASIICFDSTSDMIHAQENLNQLLFFCYQSWCFVHSKDKGASTLLGGKIFFGLGLVRVPSVLRSSPSFLSFTPAWG